MGNPDANLLRRTAELAAGWLESLDGRPGRPRPPWTSCVRGSADRSRAARRSAGWWSGSGSRGGAGTGRDALWPLLRVCDRRRLPAAARGRLAGLGLGPVPRFYACRAGRLGGRGGGRRLAPELLGLPADASSPLSPGARWRHLPAWPRPGTTSRRGGLGRRGRRPDGAPPIRVLVGARRHVSVDRALRFLGLGTRPRYRIAGRRRGRMDTGRLRATRSPPAAAPAIVCAQAGEVNTGAFDDLGAIADATAAAGAWLHVDGAFGLWAAASPALRHLVAGRRAGRLVGDRRAQVAQRPVRLRGGLCATRPRTGRR